MSKNIIDAILEERDRLTEIKSATPPEIWNSRGFVFYKHSCENLIKLANEAIGGRLDAIQCLGLYEQMKAFES